VPKILRKVLGDGAGGEVKVPKERTETTKTKRTKKSERREASATLTIVPDPPRRELTLAEFYFERFELEHVRLQKPATQVNYDSIFRNHIAPHLGEVPVAAIDEDRLSAFRARLAARVGVTTVNQVLAKVARMLRHAKRVRVIATMPEVETLRTPRARPKAVYSDEEIEALLEAARAIDTATELLCLLALDAGLRVSEICALEWGDVDLKAGTIMVQHNQFRGRKQTPKGTIGKVAMTSGLREALARHRKREPIGPLVLYRMSHRTGMEWRPYTPSAVRYQIGQAQAAAGLPKSGPHLLRHTSLTRLANLGASVYLIKAMARHSRLGTTERYLHTQQIGCAREAVEMLDRALAGKALAKRAKTRKK
jgi:integrase/recombinase XerC